VNILEVKAEVVLWFVTMVESAWGLYMQVDWDSRMCNLYMEYVQVWAHDWYRYRELAAAAVVG
jgi:hypothetical protein